MNLGSEGIYHIPARWRSALNDEIIESLAYALAIPANGDERL